MFKIILICLKMFTVSFKHNFKVVNKFKHVFFKHVQTHLNICKHIYIACTCFARRLSPSSEEVRILMRGPFRTPDGTLSRHVKTPNGSPHPKPCAFWVTRKGKRIRKFTAGGLGHGLYSNYLAEVNYCEERQKFRR